MAVILPYFSDSNYVNLIDSLNISIKTLWNELIGLDFDQQIYASNAYAFRRRSNDNKGNLNLPFLNYKMKSFNEDNTFKNWQYNTEHQGIFIPELGIKVGIRPVIFNYECSFWCNREDEAHYAMTKIIFHGDDPSTVLFYPQFNSEIIKFVGHLTWSGQPAMDPHYTEVDWLSRNNIHSISMDFGIRSFLALGNTNVSIPDEILFKFGNSNNWDIENLTKEQLYQMTIDHFTEQISEPVIADIIPPVFP